MPWLQLRVHSNYPEFAEEILSSGGALAVSLVDAADDPVLEPAPGQTPLWAQTAAVGLFQADTPLAGLIARLREQLPDGSEATITSETLEDQNWIRLWLDDWPALQFGGRLWVCPSERAVYEPGCETVILDPGLAFGTGTHPSTALCLEWLASHSPSGWRVLDYGCGSGLLAVAALKLGAATALAVDIDPQAIQATEDNARINRVDTRLATLPAHTPFRADAQPLFDLVLANILAGPLVQLAPLLAASLNTGGWIVLAGLLERQAEEVRSAYAPWFRFAADGHREGWARLSAQRR